MFNFDNYYIGYLNLDHRKDRLSHIKNELYRVGIEAERTRGKLPNEYDLSEPKLQVMANRTKGAIPCHYGQVEIIKKALDINKSAIVFEDDIIFCDDIKYRLGIIQNFLDTQDDWDVVWLGSTFHKEPTWHSNPHPVDMPDCTCALNRDWEQTDDKNIVRTYGCWSTYAYIVNIKSISKILNLLESNIHKSMGIDWLFIYLQPQLKTYAFSYGCVKQMDNQSDIGKGITKFSNFEKLGNHWFAEKITDKMNIKYRTELPKLLQHLGLPLIGIEVGTAEGHNSYDLIENGLKKLYSVDAWITLSQKGDGGFPQEWHDKNYNGAVNRLSKFGESSIILKGLSSEMAAYIPDGSAGLLYLDGDHSYEGVMNDLKNYYSKVVEGGVVSGHDFINPAYGVKEAVYDFVAGRFEVHIIEENSPENASFYFIKKTT